MGWSGRASQRRWPGGEQEPPLEGLQEENSGRPEASGTRASCLRSRSQARVVSAVNRVAVQEGKADGLAGGLGQRVLGLAALGTTLYFL